MISARKGWQAGGMGDRSELTLRHSTDDDVPAMLDIAQRAFSTVTGREAHWSEQGMRRMRAMPGRDAGRDFPVVVRADQVVAWGGVFANPPFSEVFTPLHPDPELADDDLATALRLLVDHGQTVALEAIAKAPYAEGRMLATEVVDGTPRVPELLAGMGFVRDRAEYEMAIEIDAATPAPVWPDGITLAPIRGPQDSEVVTELLAASFADHPGDVPFSLEVITHVLGDPGFHPTQSTIAHDDQGAIGLVLCRGRPGAGYVWVLGVHPRARRRGLGAALLRHAFHQYAAAGTTLVTLDVDGGNDSGALEVYRVAGMEVRTANAVLLRPLPT
jgi:ribosomal protein S18 acetylase RimI-like enzyme